MSWTAHPRFFAPELGSGGEYLLRGGEARHLAQVLRLGPGASVCLFDGQGRTAHAEVLAIGKNVAELRILERAAAEEPKNALVLATATPKGERFRWLIEKATELNVSRLIPLRTERSVVDPGAGKLDKMQQAVIAACKQCRRDRLMAVTPPLGWPEFLARHDAGQGPLLVAHPEGAAITYERVAQWKQHGSTVTVAVGPEGGLSDGEVDLAVQHGAVLVGLGPRILRVETAGIALAVLLGMADA